MKKIQRRDFLSTMGFTTGALALTSCGGSRAASAAVVSRGQGSISSAPSVSE